ncbi:MAG: SAM-dependent chlorinase/fluorinase [Candidatus Kapabacteria bacterium]|nr:SAM-dependent chlorinase/fluorinase [Candidatus Kapabacteria bacterium]
MGKIIALLTDYGLKNNFVGVMKGVIKSISNDSEIIDITHSIIPQNIKQGAFVLMNSFQFFPEGTIFVCVVDPEVGSNRLAIGTFLNGKYFLAPNNGILSYVIKGIKVKNFYSLENTEYHLKSISSTFHGRDIFAPVAAHIANGKKLEEVGKKIPTSDVVIIPNPQCFLDVQGVWHGEVIEIDIFGNIITSLSFDTIIKEAKSSPQTPIWVFESGNLKIKGLSNTFSDVKIGEPLIYIGSSGFIEVGIREGNAAKSYNIDIGQNVYFYKE